MSTVTERVVPGVQKPEPTAIYGIRRAAAAEEDPRPREAPEKRTSATSLAWSILLVTMGVWAVVGLVLWIPILVRESVRFSLALCRSMLLGTRPTKAGKALKDAAGFYPRGFEVAFATIAKDDVDEDTDRTKDGAGRKLAIELAWGAVFWYAVLLSGGIIQTTPMDAWTTVTGWPWSEWYGSFMQAMGL